VSTPVAQMADLAVTLGLAEDLAAELATRGYCPAMVATSCRREEGIEWHEGTDNGECSDPTPTPTEITLDSGRSSSSTQRAIEQYRTLKRKLRDGKRSKPSGKSTRENER